uniref:HNH endonuclease signature motif containing protein n=1 Tax=Gordonia sp. UBA7599 TaxID=1946578 RepID=UPI0025C21985
RLAVARTELIDGQDWATKIDVGIAAVLRSRSGSWSNKRLIDMIDRIIFRHDPDAVRRRHEKAKQARSVWVVPETDGMATLGATMTAHNAAIAHNAVLALAALACPHDTRSRDARSSDALFALLTGTAFECDCDREDCAAAIPEPDALAAWVADQQNQAIAKGRVLVHVIADQATVDGRDDQPAFMDGHGVISAAHLRDLLARDDVRVRPLNQTGGNARATDHNSSSGGSDDGQSAAAGVSLPTHLPSDPYRPSAALDTFIRARDGYCTIPGCDQPGWKCDIDHVQEYDHDNPGEGGHTSPDELGAKCRMHHNFKTFAHGWVDDQYRDNNGRLVSEVVSPEGIRFPGPAETNADLFPSLDHITWHEPTPDLDTAAPSSQPLDQRKPRLRNRTKDKHRRRRAERAANRKQRLTTEWQHAEQEYHRRREHPRETDGAPPF